MESQKSPGLMVRLAAALKAIYGRHEDTRVCVLLIGGGTFLGDVHAVDDGLDAQGNSVLMEMAREFGLDIGRCSPHDGDEPADIQFTGSVDHQTLLDALEFQIDILVHTNVLEETFCMVNTEGILL
jgi:hypothetical protein